MIWGYHHLRKRPSAAALSEVSSSMPFNGFSRCSSFGSGDIDPAKVGCCNESSNIPPSNIPQTQIANSLWFRIPFHLGVLGMPGVFSSRGLGLGFSCHHLRHQHQPSSPFSMLRPERWCPASGHAGGFFGRGGKMFPCTSFQNHSLGGNSKICLCSSLLGEMIQIWPFFFLVGWHHQLL